MKAHDEKTQQHIKAICDAFAENPDSVLYYGEYKPSALNRLHGDPFAYSIKPKTGAKAFRYIKEEKK